MTVRNQWRNIEEKICHFRRVIWSLAKYFSLILCWCGRWGGMGCFLLEFCGRTDESSFFIIKLTELQETCLHENVVFFSSITNVVDVELGLISASIFKHVWRNDRSGRNAEVLKLWMREDSLAEFFSGVDVDSVYLHLLPTDEGTKSMISELPWLHERISLTSYRGRPHLI